jgi:hypothetical protein
MSFWTNPWKATTSFMSSGVGKIVGIAASIAIPFVAAPIASAIGLSGLIGSTAAATLTGAALGAGLGAATGGNPLLGAALGGGASFLASGGIDAAKGLFGKVGEGLGFSGSAAPATSTVASATAPVAEAGLSTSPLTEGYKAALQGITPTDVTNFTPAATSGIASSGTAAGTTAGTTGAGLWDKFTTAISPSNVLSKLAENPGSLAPLALAMFNKPEQNLTSYEKASLEDTARLANENRALFEQRVNEAQKLIQQGTPTPEKAYAQAGMTVQRRLDESLRGRPEAYREAETRRGDIESARLGTLAVSEDANRARANEQAGLSAMPTTAPTGYAGLSLPVYQGLEKRREAYNKDLATGIGSLFGSLYGKAKNVTA